MGRTRSPLLATSHAQGGTVHDVQSGGRTRRKLREWIRRYLACEIAGTVGELGGAAVAYLATGSLAAAAIAATIGASVGYYAAAYISAVRWSYRDLDHRRWLSRVLVSNLLALRTMTMVLQGRLFDTIRQQLGGTYSIEVEPLTQKNPRPEFSVRISWACDPARVETLVQRVFDEINFVKRTPLTTDQMGRVRAALRRDWDENSQNNGYLLNQIVRKYEDGNPEGVGSVFSVPDQINALTGTAVQQAAQTYLSMDNYVRVTLMPESK